MVTHKTWSFLPNASSFGIHGSVEAKRAVIEDKQRKNTGTFLGPRHINQSWAAEEVASNYTTYDYCSLCGELFNSRKEDWLSVHESY